MNNEHYRVEHDSLGEIKVPAEALYGAQTQRACENFTISGYRMPREFIRALGQIKAACAQTNAELGLLESYASEAIVKAAMSVAEGLYDQEFPVDVFQTGSGTSSNMNANEVIANLAARRLGREVHPNDHVNCSQSSNDVIPSAVHLSALQVLEVKLLPALRELRQTILTKAEQLETVVKTGRTHLMDAMPVTMAQELGGWAAQAQADIERLSECRTRLRKMALGGTAVGTGVNAPKEFGTRVASVLSRLTDLELQASDDYFESLSSQQTALELSGHLKNAAVGMMKIANDLRWMNSGPLAGLGEISLPALQPGSSIMPGKVNPVIPEAVAMAAAQVIGSDATITIAAQSGNFQLNVMLPVIAWNLLQSLELLASSARVLGEKSIEGFTVNREAINKNLAKNPVLVTALNRKIGYAKSAEIAKQAYRQGRPILDVAKEMTDLDPALLSALLDPKNLVK